MEVGSFYVLYNSETQCFEQDSQFECTDDVLDADQYSSLEGAQKVLSYYDEEYRENLSVKKITLTMSDV